MFHYLLQQEQKEDYYKDIILSEAKCFFSSALEAVETKNDIETIKNYAENLKIKLKTD